MKQLVLPLAYGSVTLLIVLVVLAYLFERYTHKKKARRAILVASFAAGALVLLTHLP